MANILCRSFIGLRISVAGMLASRYSTSCQQQISQSKILALQHSSVKFQPIVSTIFEPDMRLTARHSIIDLGLPQTQNIKEIIDNPLNINVNIIDPIQIPQSKEDKISEISMNLPMVGNKIEKQAARLIVIRRKKMKKHKRRKLRKKMQFVWRKIKEKRELRREHAFHKELLTQIREAEKFDAKDYVASRLAILDYERVPTKWQGEVLPEEVIRKLIKQKQEERNQRRNIPKLTL